MSIWGPINYPVSLDSFLPRQIDNVDEVIANHPNSLAEAVEALEGKLGITNDPVNGLGGVSFFPGGKAANPGGVGVPTIWVDNSGGSPYSLMYTDNLGTDHDLLTSAGQWTRSGSAPYLLYPNVPTDTIQVGNGTVSNPSYAFYTDADTGINYDATYPGTFMLVSSSNFTFYSSYGVNYPGEPSCGPISLTSKANLGLQAYFPHGSGAVVGGVDFWGVSSTVSSTKYAAINGYCIDNTEGDAYGRLQFITDTASMLTVQMFLDEGLVVGTGTDAGYGHIVVQNRCRVGGTGLLTYPCYSFIDDINSGLYLGAVGRVHMKAGAAVSSMVWDGGRIGINTTSPGAYLDILPDFDAYAIKVRPQFPGTANTGELHFHELTTYGSNYIGFKAPATAVASNVVWSLPDADAGSSGQVLSSNAAGVLSWVSVDGVFTVSAHSTDHTITADEDGWAFTNQGATGDVHFYLPATAAGLRNHFYVQANKTVRIHAPAGSTIRHTSTVSISGGNFYSDTEGDYLYLVAVNSSEWVAFGIEGDWNTFIPPV